MNPYVLDVVAKERIEQLHEEAARYRLSRLAARRTMRRAWRLWPRATERSRPRSTWEQPCVDC